MLVGQHNRDFAGVIDQQCLQQRHPNLSATLWAAADQQACNRLPSLTPSKKRCCLQVLTVSGNRLRSLPADVGWLSLKQLSVVDNPDLHIPIHVLQKGFK